MTSLYLWNEKILVDNGSLAVHEDCCCAGGPCPCCSEGEENIEGVLVTASHFCDTDGPLSSPCIYDDFGNECACENLNTEGSVFIPADPENGCIGKLIEYDYVECNDMNNPNSRPETFDRVFTYAIVCFTDAFALYVTVALYPSGSALIGQGHVAAEGEWWVDPHLDTEPCAGDLGYSELVDGTRGHENCNDKDCGDDGSNPCTPHPCADLSTPDKTCYPPEMTASIQSSVP